MNAQLDDQEEDEAEAFFRSITWAEEDRHKFTTAPWRGEYRWFRSPNVVCLEKIRRLRGKHDRGTPSWRVSPCFGDRAAICATTIMFVRFRQTRTTLQLSLVETRREGGRIRHDHIAGLGSVLDPASIADRVKFWAALDERLAKLGNRLGPDVGKVMGMIHERVPMPTADEQRELQLENARADERLYSGLADMHAEMAAGQKALAASAERAATANEEQVAANAKDAAAARDRAERIERGEAVSGGLGKPLSYEDVRRILKQAGMTDAHFRHVELIGDVYRTIEQLGGEAGVEEMRVVQRKAYMDGAHRSERAMIRRVARNLDALVDNAKAEADDDRDGGSEPDLP